MNKKEYYFKSSNKDNKIYVVEWIPDVQPKAIIQIAHGICENMSRYESFAKYFVSKGFIVCGLDLIGHGRSSNLNNRKVEYSNETNYVHFISDIHRLNRILNKKYPSLPIYGLGFNIGNDFIRYNIMNNMYDYSKVIFIGDEYVSRYVLYKEYLKVLFKIKYSKKDINVLKDMYYKKYYKENDKVLHFYNNEKEEIIKFRKSRLNKTDISLNFYKDILETKIYTNSKKNISRINGSLKILLLSGDKDIISNNGLSIDKIKGIYLKNGLNNVKIKLCKGLKHDILHTYLQEEIYKYIYNWIIE